jgi:hypothetical protein
MGPGDEIICIGTSPFCPTCPAEPFRFRMPEVGRHYIVEMVGYCWCGSCRQVRPGLRSVGSGMSLLQGWPQHWFRPLEYEEDAHIVDAGVTLPIRVPADA